RRDRLGHRVEHRHAVHLAAALARRDAAHDLRAVGHHLLRMERAVAAGDALDDQARALVDQDAHAGTSCAFSITMRTASSMLVVAPSPFSFRICRAFSSFVPVRRMTSGISSGETLSDATMPFATSSQRVMPP